MGSVDGSYWWLGVITSLLACFGTVAGMMLQKYSHNKNDALPPDLRKPSYKRPMWWMSLFLMIVVPAPLDVLSLALAPQSLLAPLSAVTLLLNVLLSPVFLGEKLTRVEIGATALIFIGAVVTTAFGEHSERTYDVPGLYELYNRWEFIFFQVVSVILIFTLWLFIQRTLPVLEQFNRRARSSSDSDIEVSDSTPSPIGMVRKNEAPVAIQALPFAFGLLAGLSGAQQLVITKCVSELLSMTIKGENQFVYALTYFLIVFAAGFAVFQISYVSKGLEHFDAVLYLPIYNAFLIVLGIIAGSIYFNEIRDVSATSVALFSVGVLITLSGVLLLTKQKPKPKEPVLGKPEDSEAGVSLLDDDGRAAGPVARPSDNRDSGINLDDPIDNERL